MRPIRVLFALFLGVAAFAVASCGGGGGGGGGSSSGSVPETASLAPADAGVWASVHTDVGSAQWTALDAVLAQIPGAEAAIDSALKQVSNSGKKLDLRKDILPALGKELIVVLPFGASTPVVLAKPANEAVFNDLFTGSTPPVRTTRDGWTVIAKNQKALDAYTAAAGKGSLADSDAFKKAMDGLPPDALVRAYVNGKGLAGVAGTAAGSASGALKSIPIPGLGSLSSANGGTNTKALEQLGTIGFALSAAKNEIRVDGSISGSNSQAAPYAPKLLRRVPGDALAAASFAGSEAVMAQVRSSLSAAGADQTLAQLRQTLGVSPDDLLALGDGEGVLYVRPSLIIPEVTAVLAPKDPARALQTLHTIAGKLAASTGGKVTTTIVGGITFTVLHVSIVGIGVGRDGDRVVVTTAPAGIGGFDGANAKLVDSDRFKQAAGDVGFTDTTSGFAYVDVKGLAPLLNTIASAASGSGSGSSSASVKKLVDALSAIDSLALNSKVDGGRLLFQGAVRVG